MATTIVSFSMMVNFSNEVELTDEELELVKSGAPITFGMHRELFNKLDKDKDQDDTNLTMRDINII